MGRKKAKKRSKLIDSGRDWLNIDIQNGKANKRVKKRRDLLLLQLAVVVSLILNLILLHVILINLRQQAITLNKIEQFEQRQEKIIEAIHGNLQIAAEVAGDIFGWLPRQGL